MISHCGFQIAGITLFSVFCQVKEYKLVLRHRFHFPYHGVEPFIASVKVIGPVINYQIVAFSFQFKMALFDSVCKATANGTEKRLFRQVVVNVIETQYDIVGFAVLVGGDDAHNFCSEVGDGNFHITTLQDKQAHLFAIHCLFKIIFHGPDTTNYSPRYNSAGMNSEHLKSIARAIVRDGLSYYDTTWMPALRIHSSVLRLKRPGEFVAAIIFGKHRSSIVRR